MAKEEIVVDLFAICEWCGDLLTNHTQERLLACSECLKKPHRSYWSKGGQIYFVDGSAWGVASNLKSIYLGTEAEILKALEENKSLGDNILTMEKNNW